MLSTPCIENLDNSPAARLAEHTETRLFQLADSVAWQRTIKTAAFTTVRGTHEFTDDERTRQQAGNTAADTDEKHKQT